MLKGALHVHSTYSDGERTLADLRRLFIAEGCTFVCLSDHADAFDPALVQKYVVECASLSDERFLLVPGLEFGCDRRMHIVGFGVTSLCRSNDPQEVLAHIRRANGVSVIAHPPNVLFEWIESFGERPMGIETWNSKYDGHYAPRASTFRLLHRLQRHTPAMLAFYGQDLHWLKQYHGLFTIADADFLTSAAILHALRSGAFHGKKADLELPSSGEVSEQLLERFDRVSSRSMLFRRLASRMARVQKRLGLAVPPPLKAQLRRLF
jgi:hypothetical protein